MKKNLIIAIYSNPEHYPPTLYAIQSLSEVYDEIFVLYRNLRISAWAYPKNVRCIPSGKLIDAAEVQQSFLFLKIFWFLQFTLNFWKLLIKHRPHTILLYDTISLFAFKLLRPISKKIRVVWYHNHDVTQIQQLSPYSIGWWAAKFEHKAFEWLDIFSLPATERESYFPLTAYKGKYFFLPNYPSINYYSKIFNPPKNVDHIILVFQGSVAAGHGLEEIIPLLTRKVNEKKLQLYIKGKMSNAYRAHLKRLSDINHVSENIKIFPFSEYSKVPELASACHVGIAIHTGTDVMNATLGTASNKIYEYAALGLPILYFNNNHFNKHLSQYNWAFATNLSRCSLMENIQLIDDNYAALSAEAKKAFMEKLYFEHYFDAVKGYLVNL